MVLTEHGNGTGGYQPATIPAIGRVIAMTLSLITTTVVVVCFCRRFPGHTQWKTIPLTQWLIFAIYIDSFLFVFITAVISQGLGLNNARYVCSVSITLCLVFYMTTKVMIYLFMVERARIVRGTRKPRKKDRLYVFNFFGMLIPYIVVIILNFLYRFAYIDLRGMCIIGMKEYSMIPLLVFDAVVNIYLTTLFLVPLWSLYSFRNNLNQALRRTALRAFIGSIVTLSSSIANLSILLILKGEPGWICLMCCNADILFSVVVLHWMTSGDRENPRTSQQPAPQPNDVPMGPCKGPKMCHLDGTMAFDNNTSTTGENWRGGTISYVISEESGQPGESSFGQKEAPSVESKKLEEDKVEIRNLGRIMKRTSLTVESTREGSMSSNIALA